MHKLRCKLFALVCQGLNVHHKSYDLKIEEFNWRPVNLEGLEAKPMMMVTKEPHGMKAFLVYILSVRIGLGKAHDHSLFMHPLCMFNVHV